MLQTMPFLRQVPLLGVSLGRPHPRLGQCPAGSVAQVTFSADRLVETLTCVPAGGGGGGAGAGTTPVTVKEASTMPVTGGAGGGGGMPSPDQLVETYTPPQGGYMPGALPGGGITTGGGVLPGAGFDAGAFQPMGPALPLAPAGAMPGPGAPPSYPMDTGTAYPVGGEAPGAPGPEAAPEGEGEGEGEGPSPLVVGGLSLAALIGLVVLLD